MAVDLELLGMTQEELQDRVINKICADLLTSYLYDDEGESVRGANRFSEKLNKAARERIDQKVKSLADKRLKPKISETIEALCLQETNKWGEAIGKKLTFTEYLVKAAENYLTEEVNHEGVSKKESTWSSWKAYGTRISYLVHKHLQYSIENAMKSAVDNANKSIAEGLEKACKIKLDEIRQKLDVKVNTGR